MFVFLPMDVWFVVWCVWLDANQNERTTNKKNDGSIRKRMGEINYQTQVRSWYLSRLFLRSFAGDILLLLV